jgi:hypothetical protein
MATKSYKDRNEYNILKRKVKVEIRQAENRDRKNKCSELEYMGGYA